MTFSEKRKVARSPARKAASAGAMETRAAKRGLTQRFTILATPKMLRQLQQKAAVSGVSKGELIRRAIETYDPSAAESEEAVQALLTEIRQGAIAANRALDEAEDELARTRAYFDAKRAAAQKGA
jgi:hypothetical protein